jgi:hypothetical protein
LDNCSALSGVPACDTDVDGYGNPCDGDFGQNGAVGVDDFATFFIPDFVAATDSGVGTDMDCGGSVGVNDFATYFIPQFVQALPGPSGLACAGTTPCP